MFCTKRLNRSLVWKSIDEKHFTSLSFPFTGMGWRNSIHLGPREREKKGAHYCFFFGNGQIFLVSEAAADMYAPKKIFAVYKFHRLIWHLLLLFLSLSSFVLLFYSRVWCSGRRASRRPPLGSWNTVTGGSWLHGAMAILVIVISAQA